MPAIAGTWPAALPQDLLLSDLQVELLQGGLRDELDRGIKKQRFWFDAAMTPVKGSMLMTVNQFSQLDSFWRGTLGHGVLAFNWKHPITGEAAVMRFDAENPPQISGSSAGNKVIVTMELEIFP